MIELTLIALAGLWRSWYGMEKSFPPKAVVKIIGLLVAIGCAYVGTGDWWAILYGTLAAGSMIIAVSKFIDAGWGSWWMGLRYSIPAIIVAGIHFATTQELTGLAYIAFAIIAGLAYPVMDRLQYPGGTLGFRAMEVVAGAGAIGGLTLL